MTNRYCFLITTFTLIILWEAIGILSPDFSHLFPPLTQIFSYLIATNFSIGFGTQKVSIFLSAIMTIFRVLSGMLFALCVAIPLAISLAAYQKLSNYLLPIIQLFAPIAPIAWIPLAIVLIGIGNQTAIFIVFIGIVFVLTLSTLAAINTINQRYIEVAETLGATRQQVWMHVIFPAIMPSLITSVRLNFLGAWMAVLAAEMVGLRDGLGTMIMLGREMFNTHIILTGMIMIGFCGYSIDSFLLKAQKLYFWWK